MKQDFSNLWMSKSGKARQGYNLFALTFSEMKFTHDKVNSDTGKCNTEFKNVKSTFSV